MFHKIIIFSTLLFSGFSLKSQNVGIGTISPDSSAILELESTSQGFMMPRMNTSQRDAIVNPKQGLQIYNTEDRCIDTYDGSMWSKNCDMKNNGDATLPAETWTQKADFGGTARYQSVGFSIGSKGYIGTGYDLTNEKDFWEYDPTTNVWAQKADFGGVARYGAVGFSIGTKGYIGTGSIGVGYKKDFWEYDPTSNNWTEKAEFGGINRESAVGFSIGSKGYIGTGYFITNKKDFWEFTPDPNGGLGTWTQKADFGGTARTEAVGFSVGNKGYIGTGNDGTYKKDFWEFTPDPGGGGLGTWVQKSDFGGTARYYAIGFSIGSKGYIGTGTDGSHNNDFWEYNTIGNSWTQKADFGGVPRYNAIGFSIGSKGYIGTGYGGGYKRDFWEYNTLSVSGKEYVENIPNDAVVYKGHDWTSTGNTLYTTKEDVNIQIRGKVIGELKFNNFVINRRIVLWDNDANSTTNFFGLGINSGILRYNVPAAENRHSFFAGNAEVFYINGNGTTVCDGPMWADSYNINSDQSLKKNILPITNTLSSLLALNGYTYNWKDDNKNQLLQSGFLAQEVQKIYPHLVSTTEKGNLSVNYVGLMPMMIEGMKELYKGNEDLRLKNEELHLKLEALESKLSALIIEVNKHKK